MYWLPPKEALEKVQELVWEPSVSRYGADEGLPELREALMDKVIFVGYIKKFFFLLVLVFCNASLFMIEDIHNMPKHIYVIVHCLCA